LSWLQNTVKTTLKVQKVFEDEDVTGADLASLTKDSLLESGVPKLKVDKII